MLIVMKPNAAPGDVERVKDKVRQLGLSPHSIPGTQRVAIGVTGNKGPLDPFPFLSMPGVADAIRVSQPFKLVSREVTGLKIVTEVKDTGTLSMVADYADVLQVGARNMQNFSLLERIGETSKPVLLKRGMSATIKEMLMAAEYIASKGNAQIALCE